MYPSAVLDLAAHGVLSWAVQWQHPTPAFDTDLLALGIALVCFFAATLLLIMMLLFCSDFFFNPAFHYTL